MAHHFGNHICGLHYSVAGPNGWDLKRIYLPQVRLQSHTTINPVCFTTQLTQTFHNPNSETLSQVRYTFPLYDGVAVNGYIIRYADKVLRGVVKQKDDAKKTYQAAVERGESAGLLECLPAGVFGVTLGNVPAKTDVVVEISYCGELKHDAAIDGLRFNMPTSIAPRYGQYPGEVLKSNTVVKGGISITVDVDMAGSAIRKAQSPSHPIAVSMGAVSTSEGGNQAPFMPSQASATLTLGSTELADDFVLQLLIDDISKPQAILETHPDLPNQRALMATLVPKFVLEPAHPEIIFIADQSGSMSGSKNTALVAALKVFLKSLPVGVRFNICAFGNQFKFLWPKSQAYNEDNLNTAVAFVNTFSASYGGTEILKPITAAFEQHLSDLPLEVMLLTDGEVWQEHAVFEFINEQIHQKKVDARVFALGIGSDVSHTLVEGVARAGNGFAQFVTQNEETDQKVIRMLKGALYAHTKDYALEVKYKDEDNDGNEMTDDEEFEIVEKVEDCLKITDAPPEYREQDKKAAEPKSFFDTAAAVDKATEVSKDRYAHLPAIETPKLLQAPSTIPPLFPFNRTTLYLLLGPDTTQKKIESVTLRASSAQGPLELSIPVNAAATTDLATIHQLAAKKAIQDLEEGRGWLQAAKTADGAAIKTKYESRFDELVERECVRLGEKFQVAGKWTSFVAVEENGEALKDAEEVDGGRMSFGGREGVSHKRKSAAAVSRMARVAVPMAGSAQGARYVVSSTVASSPFAAQSTPFQSFSSNIGSTSGFGSVFGRPMQGNSNTGNSLFGSKAPNSPGHSSNVTDGLFGNRKTTCSFGSPASIPQTSDSGGLFGQTSSQCSLAAPRTSSLFGSGVQTSTQSSCFGASGPSTTSNTARQLEDESDRLESKMHDHEESSLTSYFTSARGARGGGPGMFSSLRAKLSSAAPAAYAAHAAPLPDAMDAAVETAEALEEDEDGDEDMGFGLFDDDTEAMSAKPSQARFTSATPAAASAPRKQLASKAARRSAPSSGGVSVVRALIDLQTFSGAWAWDDELFNLIGVSQSAVVKEEFGGDADVCATTLAIAYLETKEADMKDVWEMVVSKAKAWLGKQGSVGNGGVEGVVKKAAGYL